MFTMLKRCSMGAIFLLLALPGGSFAGQNHAGYSHAMDDLRLARTLLQRPAGIQPVSDSPDEVSLAIGNIESAMKQIDPLIGPNEKNQVPKVDPHMPWVERLTECLRLLDHAELSLANQKTSEGAAGVKARVFDLLDQARARLSVAVETVNFDYSSRHLPTRSF